MKVWNYLKITYWVLSLSVWVLTTGRPVLAPTRFLGDQAPCFDDFTAVLVKSEIFVTPVMFGKYDLCLSSLLGSILDVWNEKKCFTDKRVFMPAFHHYNALQDYTLKSNKNFTLWSPDFYVHATNYKSIFRMYGSWNGT